MHIQTARLHIRTLTPDDWQSMRAIAEDFRKSEYAVYDMPFPTEDAQIELLTQRFAETGLFFAVCLPGGEMIGYVCFHEENGSYDLGYLFHSSYCGKGYAFESCTAVMEYMMRHYAVRAFTAGTALKNTPSCGLLQKLGFVLKGTEILSFREGNQFEGGLFIRKEQEK